MPSAVPHFGHTVARTPTVPRCTPVRVSVSPFVLLVVAVPFHAAFDSATSSGDGSANVPFIKKLPPPTPLTLRAASPAVEITLALVVVV